MEELERLERERSYIEAARGGEFSRDAVNSLYVKANDILNDGDIARTTEIAGAKSRVSMFSSKQELDGAIFDIYLSSKIRDRRGRKDERVSILLLPEGEPPENALRDGTFIMSRGAVKSDAPAILMFDPYGTESYEDINHYQDVNFIHAVITDIRQKGEVLKDQKQDERKSLFKKITAWMTVGAVLYVPQNAIGERHTPWFAPLPVEIGVDLFNQPDHKATSFDEPEVSNVILGEETELPDIPEYNAVGAPSSWFTNDSNTVMYHDGDKPGLWRLDFSEGSSEQKEYDKVLVEAEIGERLRQFNCGEELSGQACIEEMQARLDSVDQLSRKNCKSINIEITPNAKLFTTSDSAITYFLNSGKSLQICSETGSQLDDTSVYVYNEK